jgi:DNA polymerase III delta subunit
MLVQAAGGGEAGLAALRPPAGGLRRQAIQRAAAWRRERLEEALRLTVELDLGLRGGSAAPGPALLERTLLRQAALRGG